MMQVKQNIGQDKIYRFDYAKSKDFYVSRTNIQDSPIIKQPKLEINQWLNPILQGLVYKQKPISLSQPYPG